MGWGGTILTGVWCKMSRLCPPFGKGSWHPDALLPRGSKTAAAESPETCCVCWVWLCREDLDPLSLGADTGAAPLRAQLAAKLPWALGQ